jgi:hypothetical protein
MESMPLFEQSTSSIGPRAKFYGEPIYPYYRDSERPGIIAIRTLLEQWFLEIPEAERQDLQQRFRSPIERQHRSAVFEYASNPLPNDVLPLAQNVVDHENLQL